jgi:uncharacterized protein (DUF58 family)
VSATPSPGAGARQGPRPSTNRPPGLFDVRARFRVWWQSRLPLTDTWRLGQRNIYILPTKAGLTFAGTLVIMMLASINYQLNLGFALTFLLMGAALVSMHQTHGNLRGLTLHLRPAGPGHAGEPAALEVVITNPGRARLALALHFEDRGTHGRSFTWSDVPAQGQVSAQLTLTPQRRGWHAVPPLVMETVFPFGLFMAWTVWRPAARVLAWPQPEAAAPPLPVSASSSGDDQSHRRNSGSEWDGVRPWRRGDTMRQVVWKKMARSGELVSRETAGTVQRELVLDWVDTAGTDLEARLSRMTAWVLLVWGLRLPRTDLPPGQGDLQRRAALDLLALWA